MTKSDKYERLAQFVKQISGFTQDNECQTCKQSGIDESLGCSDHDAWNMPVDDAFDTVRSLISRARQLVAELKL